MFNICLAEIIVQIDNKYPYIKNLCKDYIVQGGLENFSVSLTDAEIDAEDDGSGFDRGYLESLAIYRKIAEKIIEYDGFLMHGAVIEADDNGIAFLAKSGVGKTTHVRLWQQLLGDKMTVVNGDKPLVRMIDGKVYAYGTPWAGKENIQTNKAVELKKICFIERAENNECFLVQKTNVFEKLIVQIYRPSNAELLLKTMDLIEMLIEKTQFFIVRCNTKLSAAEISSEVLL